MVAKRALTVLTSSLIMAFGVSIAGAAPGDVVVTPTRTQGWSTADTRTGGTVSYVADSDTPSGYGALQLTTDETNVAKAQYMHTANIPLSEVTELSYYTKKSGALFSGAAASYQLPVYLNGGTNGFTTLVFEPYQNGTVTDGDWQQWNEPRCYLCGR
jgi:hypothetical protein